MHQQQQNDPNDPFEWKRNFNIAYNILLIHQRAVVVPLRMAWGPQALGVPCALALVLMVVWATFSRDPLMWGWIALWLTCFVSRRAETLWLWATGARLHGGYDGHPFVAIRLGRTENAAKLVVEPLLVGGIGRRGVLVVRPLPFFALRAALFPAGGLRSLPFVELVKQTIWKRRSQATLDARLEQEASMREFRSKYGDF